VRFIRRHRAQRAAGRLTARHDGSGSPQVSQRGGVSGRTDDQQRAHTAPRVGRSSGASQAAQAGASSTDRTASQKRLWSASFGSASSSTLDALGVTP
jgi:hypothetical protein